eukprot:scaffold1151_cov126-Isochrysis_galbana.AAC.3
MVAQQATPPPAAESRAAGGLRFSAPSPVLVGSSVNIRRVPRGGLRLISMASVAERADLRLWPCVHALWVCRARPLEPPVSATALPCAQQRRASAPATRYAGLVCGLIGEQTGDGWHPAQLCYELCSAAQRDSETLQSLRRRETRARRHASTLTDRRQATLTNTWSARRYALLCF